MKRTLSIVLIFSLMLSAFVLASCKGTDKDAQNTAPPHSAVSETAAPTDTPTTAPETEAPTADPNPRPDPVTVEWLAGEMQRRYYVGCMNLELMDFSDIMDRNEDTDLFFWDNQFAIDRMKFNPDIWKDIAQLTSNYTSYNIDYLLMMRSTYSMRIYEIILSYDNGNRNYGYNNGLVFEPVTADMRRKYHDRPDFSDLLEKNKDNGKLAEFIEGMTDLSGFKYKKFDMDEFKGLLSAPRTDERENYKSKKKDADKYNREKPLSEKYKTYGEFQRNVLAPVKEEINLLTDIWFDYVPVREKGERKFKYLYIFIKYKSKEEMEFVRAKHDAQIPDTEVIPKAKAHSKKAKAASDEKAPVQQQNIIPEFPENVCSEEWRKKWRSLIGIIKSMAEFPTYEDKLTAEEKNSLNDIFTYTSKILTNEKRRDEAEDMLACLKRISADNNGLRTWALGLGLKVINIHKKNVANAPNGVDKSAQYYRAVVYNETIENSTSLIADGQMKWKSLNPDSGLNDAFKFDMSVFDN